MFDRIALLKNMLTVALRNAQLYNSVPRLSLRGKVANIKGLPFKKILTGTGIAAVLAVLLGIIRPTEKCPGKFSVQPRQKYIIFSKVDGMVSRVISDPAAVINKGDTLLVFDSEELENSLIKEKNKALVIKQNLGYLKQNSKHSDYHTKRLELDLSEIQIESLSRKIRESVVQSPVKGRLSNNDIKNLPGQKFSKGMQLFEIIAMGDVELKLYISEKKISAVKPGQKCFFRLPAFPGKTFEGKVKQVGFDTKEEGDAVNFPVIVIVSDSSARLLPGMSGRGKVLTLKRSLLSIIAEKPVSYLRYKFWL
ncbi:MAG: efflux RND transporter periplasmic adaptor subunit, partial [bacterium]